MSDPPRLLVATADPPTLWVLRVTLETESYTVVTAEGADEALALSKQGVDVCILDDSLRLASGRPLHEAVSEAGAKVVLLTEPDAEARRAGLAAGAIEFLTKPVDRTELIVRVRTLLLAEKGRAVGETERLGVLNRYLSEPVLAAFDHDSTLLEPHRRDVAVLFIDLRGFTSFSGEADPEDVMRVIRQYHEVVGELVHEQSATVGHFAGDGVMLFWNDPLPHADPCGAAVRTALGLVDGMHRLSGEWAMLGFSIGIGVGVAAGYATLGMLGFEGRYEYTAIGPVVNLAARLSGEARDGREILVNQRAYAAVHERVTADPLPEGLQLKGYPKPVPAWQVLSMTAPPLGATL